MSSPMTLRELAALALPDLYERLKRGELKLRQVWVAARGAKKFRKAVAEGDIGSEAEQDFKAACCAGCKAMTMTDGEGEVNGGRLIKMWCGTECVERPEASPPECGCIVGIKVNGRVLPAAKTVVGSTTCPVWDEARKKMNHLPISMGDLSLRNAVNQPQRAKSGEG